MTAEFVAGVVLGAVVVLGLGYPMFASWPVRLHWLLASQAGDPFLGFAPPRQHMREVTVEDVSIRDDTVALTLGDGPGRFTTLTYDRASGSAAAVKRWYATGVPLLLVVDEGGSAQLWGPDASVSGLRSGDAGSSTAKTA